MFSYLKKSLSESRSIEDQSRWLKQSLIQEHYIRRSVAKKVIAASVASSDSSSAFWLGYQVAVQQLFGQYLNGQIAAFVVNEQRSSNPKTWKTELVPKTPDKSWTVKGEKDFVTAPDQIDCLLVGCIVPEGNESGRNSKICQIDKENIALTFIDRAQSFPVLTELQKAKVIIGDAVLVSKDILPADGYDLYVKPFRMIEDFYASMSLLGYLARLVMIQDLYRVVPVTKISVLLSAASFCEESLMDLFPDLNDVSIEVESFIEEAAALINEVIDIMNKQENPDGVWRQLRADLMLFKIGERARGIRYERAYKSL